MIPKKIHYCWVGNSPKPESVLYCIASWKKYCPDYEIIEWNERNYDFHKNLYMAQAYDAKKWGFVPDYARLDIIYQYGGIYLDTDVEVIRNLDSLLNQEGYMGFEESGLDSYYVNCGQGFGAEAFNATIKKLRDDYDHLEFRNEDGSFNLLASPHYTTKSLMRMGLVQKNQIQYLPHMTIYPTEVLCPKNYKTGKIKKTKKTFSIHHFTASWMDQKVVKEIAHNQKIIGLFGNKMGRAMLITESVAEKYTIFELTKVVSGKIAHKIRQKGISIRENFPYQRGLSKIKKQPIGTKRPVILDTSLESDNLGDEIIMDSCAKEMADVIEFRTCYHVPTHRYPTTQEERFLKDASVKLLCGTNVLSGHMRQYGLWKLKPDISPYQNVVLMGVGFDSEDVIFDQYTKSLFNSILSRRYSHSVRDSFSEKQLKSIGISNVINTGCPTMWHLTQELCRTIPHQKGEKVICTLTDYNRDPQADSIMLQTILKLYREAYFWLQGKEDYKYLKELGYDDQVILVPPTLKDYDKILEQYDLDYVGTRLHAGIRAISRGHRSLVVTIDNRARCISNDTGLKTVERDELSSKLESCVVKPFCTTIEMPWNNIRMWKEQFKKVNK